MAQRLPCVGWQLLSPSCLLAALLAVWPECPVYSASSRNLWLRSHPSGSLLCLCTYPARILLPSFMPLCCHCSRTPALDGNGASQARHCLYHCTYNNGTLQLSAALWLCSGSWAGLGLVCWN